MVFLSSGIVISRTQRAAESVTPVAPCAEQHRAAHRLRKNQNCVTVAALTPILSEKPRKRMSWWRAQMSRYWCHDDLVRLWETSALAGQPNNCGDLGLIDSLVFRLRMLVEDPG